jgi:ariadne-2
LLERMCDRQQPSLSCPESLAGEDPDLSSQEEEEEDYYADYYGNDEDILGAGGGGEEDGATDASFQDDPEHYSFTCLSEEEAWNFLDMQVKDMAREIKEDQPIVRGLLHHLHWDSGEARKRLCSGRHQLLVEAHLRPAPSDLPAEKHVACPVCLSPFSHSLSLECGHAFCYVCWRQYLKERIAAGSITAIQCMQCSLHVSLEMVRALLSAEPSLTRYHSLALAEFVQSHKLLRWCPGPNCSIVFKVRERLPKRVTCSNCTSTCCFQCGEAYHLPADCECYRRWLLKCQDDSETANYILANTKDCPSCHASIEKNGGCNHMRCARCNHDFCWVCLEKWDSHRGYYECSTYKKMDERGKNEARQALEKYLFYYQRWANHDQSLELEETTRLKILSRIDDRVAASSGTWIDWQYLLDAADLLRKSRYTLKFTYPYAYHMEGDRKPLVRVSFVVSV